MRYLMIALLVTLVGGGAYSEEAALKQCKEHFFESRAPVVSIRQNSNSPEILCKEYEDDTFFALSYNPVRKAPDWVAYRLGVDDLGPRACRTKSRKDWARFFGMCRDGNNKCTEVYYPDNDLKKRGLEDLLKSSSYRGTGFDRGHQAPAAAFAWHGCGWFRTYSMANMSPQRGSLNQNSWKHLEESVLFWSVTKGEVFVVTGPVYKNVSKKHPWLLDNNNAKHKRHLEFPGLEMSDNQADIPTASYKVIVDRINSKAIAFVIPNGSEKLPWREMAVKISLVERLTDLMFSVPEDQRNSSPDLVHWQEATPGWRERPCEDGLKPIAPNTIKGKSGRELCWQ